MKHPRAMDPAQAFPDLTARPVEQQLVVWVVEDDALFRETVVEVVAAAGDMEAPKAFGTGEEALEALQHEDAPDVVLMDLGLPGLSGLEGTRRIRKVSPTTDVVVLTVHEDTDKIFEAICAGASGYLLKPSTTGTILEAVRAAHRGEASITPKIARRVLDLFARLAPPQGDYGLTRREQEVLHCMVEGMTKKEMAGRLCISYFTIDRHLRNVYAKLHVHSRGSAVAKALKERLI